MANSRLRRRYVSQQLIARSSVWGPVCDILGDNADTTHTFCDAVPGTYLDFDNAPTTDSGNGYSWLQYLTWIVSLDYELNLTVAQRRAVADLAARIWRWKGTKKAGQVYLSTVVNRAAQIYVPIENSGPPHEFAPVLPDFYDRETTAANTPSWPIVDNFFNRFAPCHTLWGVGYGQFRVGYSRTGEPLFDTTAHGGDGTINEVANENFKDRTGSNWDTWGEVTYGTGTLTANTTDGDINAEFTDNCVQADTAAASDTAYVHQTLTTLTANTTYLLDIVYKNDTFLDKALVMLYDGSANKYWNFTTSAWESGEKYKELDQATSRTTWTAEFTGSGNNITTYWGFRKSNLVTGANSLMIYHAGIYPAQDNTLAA